MRKAFTLIELIVVIIIVGILAALGISQYSKMVEKARQTEAKIALGSMRQPAYQYYLENGTFVGISAADLGIGSGSLPSSCVSTNYFYYGFQGATATLVTVYAVRCGSGGKTPLWTGDNYVIEQNVYASSPDYIFTYDYATTHSCPGFCVPPF